MDGHTGVFSVPRPQPRPQPRHTTTHNDTTPTNQPTTHNKSTATHSSVTSAFSSLSFLSVCSVRSVFSLLVFVFYLVPFFLFPIVSNDVSCFLLCLCLFSLCFHGFQWKCKKCHMCSPLSLLVLSAVLLAVPFHLELHITKLIAAYFRNNPLVTYKMGLFRPRILLRITEFHFRPSISLFFCSQGYGEVPAPQQGHPYNTQDLGPSSQGLLEESVSQCPASQLLRYWTYMNITG